MGAQSASRSVLNFNESPFSYYLLLYIKYFFSTSFWLVEMRLIILRILFICAADVIVFLDAVVTNHKRSRLSSKIRYNEFQKKLHAVVTNHKRSPLFSKNHTKIWYRKKHKQNVFLAVLQR